ncbi:HAD family hydrolase [Secundilactobacillus paracollinoides]|uniref:HAD family hydrolase n=1 Tax=Secundilactobacillus paracollinoides TaxID=240427 RepID=A0A1B2J1P8_9LACO|nr:Cof-type HAD-IIB family hydrolase [Secundilactobacillus paracollinoides]ANZ62240.1 HAD family hydrolase [Secundilactobacillus paracollinoides]ANZ63928.1 HAD family hydrolase [Secundilactobacillus paracollinoides]ANZ68189.1 HAD family hydrolase [Secundilactobacillus paracollinoides]KRL76323.1 cof family hydrolase [Secundilactobacillus paracollinoides DSM 15502 = JCM 11969]
MAYDAIVFFDLDGTLFDNDKHVLPASIDAIKQMAQQNILSVVSTGRNIFEIQYVLDETGINSVVSANGSYVQYEGKKLHAEEIDPELIATFTDYANRQGDAVAYFNNRGFRLSKENDLTRPNFKLLRLDAKVDPDFYRKEPINFMNVFNTNKEDQYTAEFKNQLSLVRNNPRCLDTMKAGVSKKTGIEILLSAAKLENIPTYAFGDQLNDLQMFDVVDNPIAMANGHQLAKEKASYVTTSNVTDGIVHGLKHFNLIK